MSDNVELLERLADCVRLAIEDGKISPTSYVGVAWRDYAERYRFQSITAETEAIFNATGNPLVPNAAVHKAPAPAPAREAAEDRPCTCHPLDNPPVPCAKKYALDECKATVVCSWCGKPWNQHGGAQMDYHMDNIASGRKKPDKSR